MKSPVNEPNSLTLKSRQWIDLGSLLNPFHLWQGNPDHSSRPNNGATATTAPPPLPFHYLTSAPGHQALIAMDSSHPLPLLSYLNTGIMIKPSSCKKTQALPFGRGF